MTLRRFIQEKISNAFEDCGYDSGDIWVEKARRPEFGDFQCNSALTIAARTNEKPRAISIKVAGILQTKDYGFEVDVAGPGFINIKVSDGMLRSFLLEELKPLHLDAHKADTRNKQIIIDFGGPNIAKAMHVGHLRSTIIGDCLQRLAKALGYKVLSDVHLGDWGLPMGMLIRQLQDEQPTLPYFKSEAPRSFPDESPVNLADLERMYPLAASRAKEDPEFRKECSQITAELQSGHAGYLALWQHFIDISRAALKNNFDTLGVHFDLWLGESSVNDRIQRLIDRLTGDGIVELSEGAKVIRVAHDDDKAEIPPLILEKQDSGATYATTDLATIEDRMEREPPPERIIYVVDQRQHLHFKQVFRAAELANLSSSGQLEHIGFGTINGPDGKPFKTREGNVMRLSDLITSVEVAAERQLRNIEREKSLRAIPTDERQKVIRMTALAAIKFADLSNLRLTNYIFDPERFTRFEGKTGAYMLYSAVRIKSILRKAKKASLQAGDIAYVFTADERSVIVEMLALYDVLEKAWHDRAPNILCDHVYDLSQAFNAFYHNCPVITDDGKVTAFRLSLIETVGRHIEFVLDLLGIQVPERM